MSSKLVNSGRSCAILMLIVMMAKIPSQALSAACPAVEFAPDSNEARLADATTGLGINFISNLKNKASENVVISPLSLMNILNMVLLGSDEKTASQMELLHVLGYSNTSLSESRLKPHEAVRNICIVDQDGPASNQQAVNYTLANLLMTNQDLIELKQDYEKELSLYYRVKLENFSRNVSSKGVKPLHDRVNDWVKSQTNNQIEKLAEESDLSSPELVMVLLNAAYFKARWLHTFNVKSTQDRTFYNLGKETVDVKFMSQKGVFGYADFNTNATPTDVLVSDLKTKTSDDEETILIVDVPLAEPAGNASSVTATTTTTNTAAPVAAVTGESAANVTAANSSTTEQPKASSTSPVPVVSPEPSAPAPPTIELSKDEARRLELTSKLNCSAIMLPFSLNDGQDLSMVLLLPAKRDGLGELLANLNAQSLNEIYRSLTEQRVKIELPKFNFESSYDAKETLKSMGLNAIFKETADLSRMFNLAATGGASNSSGPVKVDKVIHKVKIGVDESGAEAAAASMVTLDLRNFVRPATPTFVADHPFLFIIRHNKSNMPLFMGQVNRL